MGPLRIQVTGDKDLPASGTSVCECVWEVEPETTTGPFSCCQKRQSPHQMPPSLNVLSRCQGKSLRVLPTD